MHVPTQVEMTLHRHLVQGRVIGMAPIHQVMRVAGLDRLTIDVVDITDMDETANEEADPRRRHEREPSSNPSHLKSMMGKPMPVCTTDS